MKEKQKQKRAILQARKQKSKLLFAQHGMYSIGEFYKNTDVQAPVGPTNSEAWVELDMCLKPEAQEDRCPWGRGTGKIQI